MMREIARESTVARETRAQCKRSDRPVLDWWEAVQAGGSPGSSLRVSAPVDAVMPSATKFLLAKLNQ